MNKKLLTSLLLIGILSGCNKSETSSSVESIYSSNNNCEVNSSSSSEMNVDSSSSINEDTNTSSNINASVPTGGQLEAPSSGYALHIKQGSGLEYYVALTKVDEYEGFENNDSKMKAVELENYYKEQGLSDEDAMNFVLASKSMTTDYKKGELNKKETYINELNASGAQNESAEIKNRKAELLMEGVKHMQGKKVNTNRGRKAPSNTPEMNK